MGHSTGNRSHTSTSLGVFCKHVLLLGSPCTPWDILDIRFSPDQGHILEAVLLLEGSLLITGLITPLIAPLNGLIGVTPIISRVITPVIDSY